MDSKTKDNAFACDDHAPEVHPGEDECKQEVHPTSERHHGTSESQLFDSVYVWACGDQVSGQDDDVRITDMLIGWLVLLALAYLIISFRAGPAEPDGSYIFSTLAAAMYLLITTATPDLRSGFSLLVDGTKKRYRLFGAAIVGVFGLMVTAAMRLLFSSSENGANLLINSVTVLFIYDLDEKALAFFVTVPHKWRLFWAFNVIGMSFTLALIGIVYVGDPAVLNTGDSNGSDAVTAGGGEILKLLPAWFLFAVNPAAVTFISFALSSSLQTLFDAREADGKQGARSWRRVFSDCIGDVAKAVRNEPCFYPVICVWLVAGFVSWYGTLKFEWSHQYPSAFQASSFTSTSALSETSEGRVFTSEGDRYYVTSEGDIDTRNGPEPTSNIVELVIANVALVVGLAMLAIRWANPLRFTSEKKKTLPRTSLGLEEFPGLESAQPAERMDENSISINVNNGSTNESSNRSRVPSVLVGWGIGFWVSSLLFLLASSMDNSGWAKAPLAASVVGYILLPLVFVTGIFIVADEDFFGHRIERIIKPAVRALKKHDGVFFWVMVTILRDAVLYWAIVIDFVSPVLQLV